MEGIAFLCFIPKDKTFLLVTDAFRPTCRSKMREITARQIAKHFGGKFGKNVLNDLVQWRGWTLWFDEKNIVARLQVQV